MVFFTYSKYNFRNLEDNSRKKVYSISDLKNIQNQISNKYKWANESESRPEYGDEEQSDYDSNEENTNNIIQLSNYGENRAGILQDDDYSDSEDNDEDEDDDDFEFDDESSYFMKRSDKMHSKTGGSKTKRPSGQLSSSVGGDKYRIKKAPSSRIKGPNNRIDREHSKGGDDNFYASSKPSIITIYNLDYLFPLSVRFA